MSQSTAIAPFVVIIISQMADLFVDHDAPCPSNVRWFDLRREGSRWDLYSIFSLPSSSLVLMISHIIYFSQLLIIRTGSGMVEFETTEEAVEALVLVNNLRVEGVQGEAEGMEFDIKLCFSRTFV